MNEFIRKFNRSNNLPIKIIRKIWNWRQGGRVISWRPKNSEVKGRVLLSYLPYALLYDADDKFFEGHTNKWECREIARILQDAGYEVDAIHYQNTKFRPRKKYNILFDIDAVLQRLSPLLPVNCKKILHLTTSYSPYQNAAEQQRIKNLQQRRPNSTYTAKRQIKNPELSEKSLQLADYCSLIGTAHTLQTYPEKYHSKINLVTVTASVMDKIKSAEEFVPAEKEFVWFAGGGAVHKGLDLLLEIFSRQPQFVLNIIGVLSNETDFLKIYDKELHLPNIHYHGPLNPNSEEFRAVVGKCFCFINPSCSESISTAAATCLVYGLFPLISRDTGIALPENCGRYLETCSLAEIEKNIREIYNLSDAELAGQIAITQQFARENFSREKFTTVMEKFFNEIIKI
jgi:Glycosyltransferase